MENEIEKSSKLLKVAILGVVAAVGFVALKWMSSARGSICKSCGHSSEKT